MKNTLIYIYRMKKILLSVSLIGLVILLILAFAWIFFSENNLFEPVIVFLGFIIAIIELLPSAILIAYPDAKYQLSAKAVYAGIFNFGTKKMWVSNSRRSDFKDKSVKNIQLFIELKNKSDSSVLLKGIEIRIPSKKEEYPEDKKAPIKIEDIKPTNIPIGEVHFLPLKPFLESISPKHRAEAIMANGCRIPLSKTVINDILRIKDEDNL